MKMWSVPDYTARYAVKRARVFLYVFTVLLAGCSYTVNYYSRPPEVEEKMRIQNPIVHINDASLFVRPANGVMLPVGTTFGLAKRGDLHDSGYYGAYDESKAASHYLIVELLVDSGAGGMSVKPSAITLDINEQTICPDAYILAEALRRPKRDTELLFWRTSHLCMLSQTTSFGSFRYPGGVFDIARYLLKVEKDTQIEFAAGQPHCLALKFPVNRPDPRTANFTLSLSQAIAIAVEWRTISPIQFIPFKSSGSGQIM